jgi:hypothetical protein
VARIFYEKISSFVNEITFQYRGLFTRYRPIITLF